MPVQRKRPPSLIAGVHHRRGTKDLSLGCRLLCFMDSANLRRLTDAAGLLVRDVRNSGIKKLQDRS